MKLKTLKDIFGNDRNEFKPASYGCSCGSCSEGCFGSCNVIKLKAEAIKWVKEIDKDEIRTNELGEIFNDPNSVRNFIKHFFNLTEEDLK